MFHISKLVLLSTGGYGYVFVAQDTQSGKEYALKVYTYHIVYLVDTCILVCMLHVHVYMHVHMNVEEK